MIYQKSQEFLNKFTIPIDFDKVAHSLAEISKINYALHNCDDELVISFDESMLFGKSGSVKGNHIFFNKTRLETLCLMKIDCNNSNHIKQIYDFYNSYIEQDNHSIYEKSLYEFMKKYIDNGYERYFSQMGSYKTIKFELLDTIFHENEHIFQEKYKRYLTDIKNCPADSKSLVLTFTMLFNKIYEHLLHNKIEFEYIRENYIFPIEFDARYEAMINLNSLKQKYFSGDEIFSQYLVNSSLLPADFYPKETAKQIFKDYERLYSLYRTTQQNDFEQANSFVLEYKQEIIQEIARRYEEMILIVKHNQEELNTNKLELS